MFLLHLSNGLLLMHCTAGDSATKIKDIRMRLDQRFRQDKIRRELRLVDVGGAAPSVFSRCIGKVSLTPSSIP